jgi:hypothetical protein
VALDSPEGRRRVGSALADFYDGGREGGLFRVRPTSPADQRLLLDAIDRQLSPEDRAACEGALGAHGIAVD